MKTPSLTPEELRAKFLRYVCQTSPEPLGLVVDQAEGCYIFTQEGERYLDFLSGIGVANVGHRLPQVIEAIHWQAQRYLHTMVYGEHIQEPQVLLAEQLAQLCPGDLSVVYFTNSGTEANEGALKLAKKYTGRHRFIAFEGSYHGDSHGSLSVTGREVYRKPFEPLLPGVEFLPWNDLSALEAIDETVAGVITEPIQGEGGVRLPDPEFLPALRERCNQVGALLIFDEVQTGLGRTGKLFACQHWEVVPDILVLAKALGGGLPLGAFISRPEVMKVLSENPPLCHVTTFGGHPLSCAAGKAALDYLLQENLVEQARKMGDYLMQSLQEMKGKTPIIRDVRGKGLLIGIELENGEITRRFVAEALNQGLILGWTLHTESVVRIAPPLTLSLAEAQEGLNIIEFALRQSCKGP